MIDVHSHILPGIDDGSRDVSESFQMLRELKKQGVDTVVATPHFYAHQNSPEVFFQRREKAMQKLKGHGLQDVPKILLGAEVLYFDGISHVQNLSDFQIEGTELLLIEMPFEPWSSRCVNEILSMNERKNCTVVLAHIERYITDIKSSVLLDLLEEGIKMQVNASFFLKWSTKHKALSMLKKGMIHFIGSDCHNMSSRPPRIGEAMTYIEKKCNETCLSLLKEQEMLYFAGKGVVR